MWEQLELALNDVRNDRFDWVDPWDKCEVAGCPMPIEMYNVGLCYDHHRRYEEMKDDEG